ncbi:MAG: alpha/beta hydrolase [Burkholderiaceae bacterium]
MKLNIQNHSTYVYTGTPTLGQSESTIVLLHGAQNDHTVWALQSRYLAHHGHRVLAVDLPGHGRSAGTPLPTIDALADWTIELLDATDTASAFVVGHSMGSLIALAAAARIPDRMRGIGLVGTAYPMQVSDVLLDAAANNEDKAIEMIANWSLSGINHRPGAPGPGFSVYMGTVRLMQRQQAGVLLNDFNACNQYDGGLDAADKLRCPVLFVSGARDMMTPPRATQVLFDRISTNVDSPAPTRVVLPDCGHQIMGEQPDGLLDALKQFVQA